MQTNHLAILAIRLLAIYVSIQGFVFLAELMSIQIHGPQLNGNFLLAAAFTLLTPICMAGFIWYLAPLLAKLCSSGLTEKIETGNLTAPTLIACAFVVAGVVILTFSAPSLVTLIVRSISNPDHYKVAWLIAPLLQCCLAVLLIFRASSISRVIFQLRYAGSGHKDL